MLDEFGERLYSLRRELLDRLGLRVQENLQTCVGGPWDGIHGTDVDDEGTKLSDTKR